MPMMCRGLLRKIAKERFSSLSVNLRVGDLLTGKGSIFCKSFYSCSLDVCTDSH